MFSPYYAWARRGDAPDPVNHCALNVALYGSRAARWSMTERGADHVTRSRSRLSIGPSTLQWNGADMQVDVDERCAPIPRRMRGSIRLTSITQGTQSYAMDAAGRHRWTPYAPCAHVDVRMRDPNVSWSGIAYLDSNFGTEPIDRGFRRWDWSRAATRDGTVVLYDVLRRGHEARHLLALRFDARGDATSLAAPTTVALPRTGWRISRQTRADRGADARVLQTLEDGPFYSRSLLETRLAGRTLPIIHESLDLDRLRAPWVQCLLPFRMPRRIF